MGEVLSTLVLARSGLSFAIAFLATLFSLQRSRAFGRTGYWLWLAFVLCNAAFAPLLYTWISSYPISYLDAALFRVLHAGAWVVAGAYAAVLGVLVGGLVGHFLSRRAA